MSLTINRDRLLSEIDELASFSDAEAPAVTRIVFTPTDLKAREWMKAHCEEAGLTVRQDAVGNIFARWNGSDAAAPVVGTGSHIDAIPNAGKFDGVVLKSGVKIDGFIRKWPKTAHLHGNLCSSRSKFHGTGFRPAAVSTCELDAGFSQPSSLRGESWLIAE